MNENNPYEAPSTELSTADSVGDPRGVEAGRGTAWLGEGFAFFKQSPLIWVVIMVVMFVIQAVLALIPIIGQIAANLIWPALMAGIMTGCAALDDGDDLTVGHLFAGFSAKMGPLLGLGGMYFVMLIAIGIIVGILAAITGVGAMGLLGAADGGGIPGGEAAAAGGIVMLLLIAAALFVPAIMAVWFAPALVMLADKGVFEALKLSFVGCLKNILPFLLYGIVSMILIILGSIPLGLGLLVVFPMLMASVYASYKDVFGVD